MKHWLTRILLAFSLIGHSAVFAVPLWSNAHVKGDDFLLGTIHIGDHRLDQLPSSIKLAIDKVDVVVVETDMSTISPLEQQRVLGEKGLLPEGVKLKDILSPAVYERVAIHLASHGRSIEAMHSFKPWLVALTMVQMSYADQGFDADRGVDLQVVAYAKQQGKTLIGLESFEQQMSFFGQIFEHSPNLQADDLLLDTLDELEQYSKLPQDMMNAWFQADMAKFESIYSKTLNNSEFDRAAEKILLTNRNHNWLSKLEPLIAQKSVLIAVGTLHFTGPSSLKKLLKTPFTM